MTVAHKNKIADTEKEVVQLNNDIVEESKKIENLQMKIKAILEKGNAFMSSHNNKVQNMNKQFEKTRIALYSNLKNLSKPTDFIFIRTIKYVIYKNFVFIFCPLQLLL